MGCGGQNEPVGKSGITSDQKRGSIVSCGPSRAVVEMPDIRITSRPIIFSLLCLGEISLFIFATDVPTCFATVADRSAMHGRARA